MRQRQQRQKRKMNTIKKHTIMRTLRYLAATVACMLLSASAYAQTNIAKAMDDLIGNKSYAQYIKSEIYKERDSSGHVSYCYMYGFSLPESKAKVLDNIQRAFDKDADQAYKITKRSSGMSDDRLLMRISYGVNSDKEILLGTKTDFNYNIMLFDDSQDNLYRYVYAIRWKEDAAENRVEGTLYQIYGRNPQRAKGDDAGMRITNGMDFLKVFGNLRAAFLTSSKDASNVTFNTGLIYKVVEMCKKYGHMLSNSEKSVCIEGITSMQNAGVDNYSKALLREAVNELK